MHKKTLDLEKSTTRQLESVASHGAMSASGQPKQPRVTVRINSPPSGTLKEDQPIRKQGATKNNSEVGIKKEINSTTPLQQSEEAGSRDEEKTDPTEEHENCLNESPTPEKSKQ